MEDVSDFLNCAMVSSALRNWNSRTAILSFPGSLSSEICDQSSESNVDTLPARERFEPASLSPENNR